MWPTEQGESETPELDEQKCTQKIGIPPEPTKKQRIKRIDELDEFYCTINRCTPLTYLLNHSAAKYSTPWLIRIFAKTG